MKRSGMEVPAGIFCLRLDALVMALLSGNCDFIALVIIPIPRL